MPCHRDTNKGCHLCVDNLTYHWHCSRAASVLVRRGLVMGYVENWNKKKTQLMFVFINQKKLMIIMGESSGINPSSKMQHKIGCWQSLNVANTVFSHRYILVLTHVMHSATLFNMMMIKDSYEIRNYPSMHNHRATPNSTNKRQVSTYNKLCITICMKCIYFHSNGHALTVILKPIGYRPIT